MSADEERSYDNKGLLFQAIKDFKVSYCQGLTKDWPLYWREFADQAFADIIAMEFLMDEGGIEVPTKLKPEDGDA